VLFTPVITAQPTNITVIAGSPAAFAVSASSDSALAYQWRKAGTEINGATNTSLIMSNVQPANAGNYDVVCRGAIKVRKVCAIKVGIIGGCC
jgi:hypothetical protein